MASTHPEAVPFVSVPLHAPLSGAQLTGRACIYCGAEGADIGLEYTGWVHTPTALTPGAPTLSCPVSACTPCRAEHPVGAS